MGGVFDWRQITEGQIIDLANNMFDVADVPTPVRDEYWQQWNILISSLR
jgi:hypothetical protein